jgi:hypothetical protein
MANRTALMEWLEQTKRVSKTVDYFGLDIIDNAMNHLHLLCPELFRRHRKFFNDLCDYYHKDNPLDFLNPSRSLAKFNEKHDDKSIHEWQASFCRKPTGYPKGGCKAFKLFRRGMTEQLDIQIDRFKKAQEMVRIQWWEVIDFMWERPELVNPAMLDDYIRKKVYDVCDGGQKKNPLKNGMMSKFGKMWMGDDHKWHVERRKRF